MDKRAGVRSWRPSCSINSSHGIIIAISLHHQITRNMAFSGSNFNAEEERVMLEALTNDDPMWGQVAPPSPPAAVPVLEWDMASDVEEGMEEQPEIIDLTGEDEFDPSYDNEVVIDLTGSDDESCMKAEAPPPSPASSLAWSG
ncbi:uncharacterized protein LOC110990355 [Acanthaster planci]|uniref:Uncharacterized protein LOC110990355 n=1 Tax=Acanthaster planci TaxID=133434 RepID=A0A8B8A4Z7_ACAPL|nr:uncharacterized protein LOC110990355 [Acanthaster planci]